MKCEVIQKILEKQDSSHLNQYLAVATVTITVFTIGIHMGWMGPSIPKLLSSEYPFNVTAEEASYIAIVSPIGHVAGGFLASYLNDVIGRKRTILLVTAIPEILSFALIACSFYGTYFLYLARVIGGISEGACMAIVPNYIAEITDPSVRGSLGTTVVTTASLGCLFINVLGSYVNIYSAAAICLAFPVMFLLTFSQMPETPYYLLMKNRTEEAEYSLQILRRKKDVNKEMLQLAADVQRQTSETGTFKDLFAIDSNRKAFWLAVASRSFNQWTGIFAFITYFQVLLAEVTTISPAISSSALILIQTLAAFGSWFYINHFGRRAVFGVSASLTSLSLTALAVHVTLRDYTDLDLSNVSWLPLVYLTIYIITFQGGLGVGVNIFIGEVFSVSIKAKAYSLMSVVLAFYMTVIVKFYQYTADNFGVAVPIWVFAIVTFIGIWFFLFVMPETKGKSLETIQQELKGNKT